MHYHFVNHTLKSGIIATQCESFESVEEAHEIFNATCTRLSVPEKVRT